MSTQNHKIGNGGQEDDGVPHDPLQSVETLTTAQRSLKRRADSQLQYKKDKDGKIVLKDGVPELVDAAKE